MAASSGAKSFLTSLLKKPENSVCADCGQADPRWASVTIGVFLCPNCAGIHRSLGTHISKIKSVDLDNWEESCLKTMESIGNLRARQMYEMHVPLCYHRPTEKDPMVLREQWIRRKYELKEFQTPDRQRYTLGKKEGYLWKRGKDDKKFLRRKFILSEADNTLAYYVKEDRSAKAIVHIDIVNVTLVPDKVGSPNGMQIMFDAEGHTRSIYVYAEQAKDIIDWYMAIRSAKLNRLRIAYPFIDESLLAKDITHDFLKEGWLQKTGPRASDAFRKRFVSLDRRKLMYFDDPMNAYPKGEIYLGTRDQKFAVLKGAPPEYREVGYCFTLKTPERKFVFSSDSDEERNDWMTVINSTLETPMTPRDSGNVNKNQAYRR